MTISKYHSWYLCQISLQIMLLPIQIRLRNERRNSILMTHHYLDVGSTSDWLKEISHAVRLIRTRHQYGISMIVLRRHFAAKPVVASRNVGCFVRLGFALYMINNGLFPRGVIP